MNEWTLGTYATAYDGNMRIKREIMLFWMRFLPRIAHRNAWRVASCIWISLAIRQPLAALLHVPNSYSTIQEAIDAASGGDKVVVAPGTYVENIDFRGKGIRVVSQRGPSVTVIDGSRSGSVVTFNHSEELSSVLKGFTIRNGSGHLQGGGIHIENASPTILKNVIKNNVTDDGGGGIQVFDGNPVIEGNVIKNNRQEGTGAGVGGGGILVKGGSPQILNNIIVRNQNSVIGGGISLAGVDSPTIANNRITDNILHLGGDQSQGGGIYVRARRPLIVQNLIARNLAGEGGGVYWRGTPGPILVNNTIVDNDAILGSAVFGEGFDSSAELVNNLLIGKPGQPALYCGSDNNLNLPTIRFNDVFSQGASGYDGICPDSTGSDGNLSIDPGFRSASPHQYRLSSKSPVIDAGTLSVEGLEPRDYYGGPRVVDGDRDDVMEIDLGCDEFEP